MVIEIKEATISCKAKAISKASTNRFNYFLEQLKAKFDLNKSGSELADFLEKTVGNGIVFTQIVVQNDLDAFKVFETLNARGVKLSTADLLKNYLFRLTHQMGALDLEEAERRWQNISDTLRSSDLTTYIRHFWNSRFKLERQPTLFKAIKREIVDANKAFQLLDDLEQNIQYYTAFNDSNDEIWDKEERIYLRVLNMLEVSTCYSLLLSGIKFFLRQEFKILLREISVITFRYNISALNPNEAERQFSSIANQIANGSIIAAKDATIALKSIYVIDDNFEQTFSTISLNTRREKELAKYILVKLENQIAGTDYQPEDASSTIEHILPETPGSNWETNFPYEIQDDNKYRLGNYTLLEASINHKLNNNMTFAEKLEKYKISKYLLSKEYCNYEEFKPSIISLRQQKMAKLAKTIWKSAFIKTVE